MQVVSYLLRSGWFRRVWGELQVRTSRLQVPFYPLFLATDGLRSHLPPSRPGSRYWRNRKLGPCHSLPLKGRRWTVPIPPMAFWIFSLSPRPRSKSGSAWQPSLIRAEATPSLARTCPQLYGACVFFPLGGNLSPPALLEYLVLIGSPCVSMLLESLNSKLVCYFSHLLSQNRLMCWAGRTKFRQPVLTFESSKNCRNRDILEVE